MKKYFQIALMLCIATGTYAQINSKVIDDIVYDEMIRQELPGLAVGVYKKGVIDFTKGYGHIDYNRTKAITTSTPFRWASISKMLTAVAALQLDERKSGFEIEDKVIEHYPYWVARDGLKDISDKSRKSKITIKQLLMNRSGINHYDKGTDYRKSRYNSDNDHFNAKSCVDIFRDMPLEFDPGSKYGYSTYGFNLLGAVIDEVTGSYPNWVMNSIANKLGMTSLKVSYGDFSGFEKNTDGVINTKNIKNKEYVLPGGGWQSNIGDLLKFGKGILNDKLLNNTSRLWESGNSHQYKHGTNSISSTNDFRVWHGGSHGNLRTNLYLMPNRDIAVAVMIPAEYADAFNIVRRIMDEMGVDRNFDEDPMDECGAGMKSSTKKYIGVWRKSNDDVILRRGYTSSNFYKEYNFLRSKGYYLDDFEYINNRWDGIFKKGTGSYAMWRNFDHDGFNTKWKEMNSKGYRLYDLETYVVNGQRKWAGLFKKSTGKYALLRNYSSAAFGAKRSEYAKNGLKLIDIEVYQSPTGLKWSGVWVAGTDGLLNRNYSYSDFLNLVNSRDGKGYQLTDVETYMVGTIRKWAGIWEKSNEDTDISIPADFCTIMKMHKSKSDNNYELVDLLSY